MDALRYGYFFHVLLIGRIAGQTRSRMSGLSPQERMVFRSSALTPSTTRFSRASVKTQPFVYSHRANDDSVIRHGVVSAPAETDKRLQQHLPHHPLQSLQAEPHGGQLLQPQHPDLQHKLPHAHQLLLHPPRIMRSSPPHRDRDGIRGARHQLEPAEPL